MVLWIPIAVLQCIFLGPYGTANKTYFPIL